MKIHQIYTDSVLRNFTYIIELNNQSALVIDPWCDKQINNFLQQNHLSLFAIINTHEHWDHTQGNEKLVAKHKCGVWAHSAGKGKIPALSRILQAGEKIELDDNALLEVIDTPGHSQAHLCFILSQNDQAKAVFTGDILFNAGVGRCDNGGNIEDLYQTVINKIAILNDDVLIYPGHEYLKNNLEFTLNREPNNPTATKWLLKQQQNDLYNSPLVTTIADEKEINTFLRLDNSEIINNLATSTISEKQVFFALRNLRDKW